MIDETIIELFFDRSEQAITELDVKYGKVFHKLSFDILNNILDAEECVNDSYLGVWNSIPPVKPNSLLAYVCKIVRNLSLKRYKMKTAIKRNSAYDVAMEEIDACLSNSTTVESEIEKKELVQMIENFLDTLSSENRVIFLRRYWFAASYSEIAKEVGISESNVSVRLTRMRKQMRDYLVEREVLV